MKILNIGDTFLNVNNIIHFNVTDVEDNAVCIEAEASNWRIHSYIEDCTAKEVIEVLTKCLNDPNKTVIKVDLEVRILQQELSERRDTFELL
jgi:hypothetical protein